jgi:hypothetical protein
VSRRVRWVLLIVLVPLAYLGVRFYAQGSHSLETVLGLAPGNPVWHGFVAATLLVLRFAAYGVFGGAALAWPLEEWFLRRRERRASGGADPGLPPVDFSGREI